jgi:hypothetical protein
MEADTQLTVDLYVRADAPVVDRRNAVIGRLERLERQDRIAGFRLSHWPSAISLDLVRERDDDGIHEVVRSFETWAGRNDRRITPSFDVRTPHSSITGESDDLLVLPVMCIAAYDGDDLVGVAPSSDGGSVHTVADALDSIEAGDPPVPDVPLEGGSDSEASDRRDAAEVTDLLTLRPGSRTANSTERDE